MGMMNFFKGKKKKFEFPEHFDVDVPLPPPPIDDNFFNPSFQQTPSLPSLSELDPPPPLFEKKEREKPSLGMPPEFVWTPPGKEEMKPIPSFPSFPSFESWNEKKSSTPQKKLEFEEYIPEIEIPSYTELQKSPSKKPVFSAPISLEQTPIAPMMPKVKEAVPLVSKSTKKPQAESHFLGLASFQQIENSLSDANSLGKSAHETLNHLTLFEEQSSGAYEHLHKQMEDCHKKLLFCEITLFNG